MTKISKEEMLENIENGDDLIMSESIDQEDVFLLAGFDISKISDHVTKEEYSAINKALDMYRMIAQYEGKSVMKQ